MDENHMSEGDNNQEYNLDQNQVENMNGDGSEGPNSSTVMEGSNINNPNGTSMSRMEVLPEVNENIIPGPDNNLLRECFDIVVSNIRTITSENESSMSPEYENLLSPEPFSGDELEPAASNIENEDESEEEEEHPVMRKTKPKHNWFIIPEIVNRQLGYSSKRGGRDIFQRRCYGSLHCAQRLELLYKLNEHDGCVNSLNFNSDGTLLASGSDDLNVIIWDWKIGKSIARYDTKHRSNVLQSKFLDFPGELQIATCARDGQVRLSHVTTTAGLRDNRKLGAHRGACHKLSTIRGHPHIILSAGEDGVVFQYDIREPKPNKLLYLSTDKAESIPLYSINSHPLKTHEFCVSGRDYIIRSYDQRKCGDKEEPLNIYYPKEQWEPSNKALSLLVTSAIYNHNGTEILASYNDDDIFLFDVDGTPGTFVHNYQGHRNGATIKGVNFFGPKSEFIISGSDCGNVYLWEKNTEAIVNWMMADDNGVTNCLEPHPEFPFICTSGLDWDVKVWTPSCESDPIMAGLAKTVQTNKKARSELFLNGIAENRILWMLFRHFRNQTSESFFHNRYSRMDPPSPTHSSRSSNSDFHSDSPDEEGGISECSPS